MNGIKNLVHLHLLDIGNNQIQVIEELDDMRELNEFWMNGNRVENWAEVEKLQSLPSLTCVYLEENPFIQSSNFDYRHRLKSIIPNLTQIDAEECT
jgi:Leucine-rich repeat (LRR) protein